MKITYLKLKNFAAIDVTLHTKRLEIDFSKMVNPILLFIGPIGSCKTYILSQLQPFAYMGNVDLRHGEDMILPGKDGEKEIHYLKSNGDVYVIRHYYIAKKNGRQIRSYIEKNGVEMNTSGLVTSFNELIEIEFGIDIGFLKILRLGSNVNNLVRLGHTNRKEFAVKLLSEIDEYIRDYKNAVASSRECNSELSIIVDKLKKFGDESAETRYKEELWNIEQRLEKLKQDVEEANRNLYTAKGKIETQVNSSVESLRELIINLNQTRSGILSELMNISREIENIRSVFLIVDDPQSYIDELNSERNENERELARIVGKIEVISQSLESNRNSLTDLDNQVRSIQEIDDESNIRAELKEALEFDNQYKKYYENFSPKCTRDDILEDIALMQTIRDMILSVRELSSSAREMYFKGYQKKKNPRDYCVAKLIKLKTELSLCSIDKAHSEVRMIPPIGCIQTEICPFFNALKEKEFRSIHDIKKDIDVGNEALKVCDAMSHIKSVLDARRKIFPYKVEFANVILDIMEGTMKFFDFDEASQMVTFLEKFEEWKDNRTRMQKYESQLEIIRQRKESADKSVIERRNELVIQISNMEKTLNGLHKKKKHLKKDIEICEEVIEDAKHFFELLRRKEEQSKSLREIDNELTVLDSKITLLNEFDTYVVSTNQNIEQMKAQIKELEQLHFQTKVRLMEYIQLREQKDALTAKYNEVELVKNAVSSNRGIPLLYLNAHFGRARNIANRIISEVCGDAIQLERIIIDDKEFRIPYTKNGIVISDAIQASQGETSVISMALSFALIEEFIGTDGYNILLLDEVDGPLDIDIKAHLLRMLEKRMQAMNCEQLFMITHNPLFENYPVDVFVTIEQDNQLDSYKNINRIN